MSHMPQGRSQKDPHDFKIKESLSVFKDIHPKSMNQEFAVGPLSCVLGEPQAKHCLCVFIGRKGFQKVDLTDQPLGAPPAPAHTPYFFSSVFLLP